MKILKSLFLIVIAIFVLGCSEEENYRETDISDNVDMKLIGGTWLLSSAVDPFGNDQSENGDCDTKLTITETSAIFRYYSGVGCNLLETIVASYEKSGNIITINLEGNSIQLEIVQLTETVFRYKQTSSATGGNYYIYVYRRTLSDDYTGGIPASIAGTWQITSLTSNGTEKLSSELEGSAPPSTTRCYWTEEFTEMTKTHVDFSGDDCTTETVDDPLTYVIAGTTLSYSGSSFKIIELSETTLKLQRAYEVLGEAFVDIYTYTRPGSGGTTGGETTGGGTTGGGTTGGGTTGGETTGGGTSGSLAGTWLLISDVDQDGIEYVEEGDCDSFWFLTDTTIAAEEYYGISCDLSYVYDPLPYTLVGDSIVFSDYGEVITLEILELTPTTLIFRDTYTDMGVVYTDVVTFIRQ